MEAHRRGQSIYGQSRQRGHGHDWIDEIIRRAEKEGWIKTVRIDEARGPQNKALIGDAASAALKFGKVFTEYAVKAGITSQLDSPVPGPADALALGILVFGLIQAGQMAAQEISDAQQAQAATATAGAAAAGAAANATPAAKPTTTTTAPPIAISRRNPGQTCDDKLLDELEKQKKDICTSERWTCSDSFEKIGKKKEQLLTCVELLPRIARGTACVNARKRIQKECYAGSPEPGHNDEITQLSKGLKECVDKAAIRGPGGGPCP